MKKIILSLFAILTMLAGAQAQVILVYKNGTLVATYKNTASDTYKAVLAKNPKVGSITISGASTLNAGKSTQMTATVSPEGASTDVTWSISPTGQGVTIDSDGTVTAASTATAGTYTITATANDGSGVTATYSLTVVIVKVTAITLDKTSVLLAPGGTSTFSVASVTPTDATDKTVTWSLSDNTATGTTVDAETGEVTAGTTEGTAILTATANDGSGVTAQAEINVISSSHEYVDLGLPSGTVWATTNIGAANSYDYGIYFAWGATEGCNKCASGSTSTCTIHNFNWANAPFNNGQSWYSEEYFTSTGRAEATGSGADLVSKYDAATANWGSGWRMPTYDELDELSNCSWTWYASGNSEFNGVAGYKVTSLKTGYTDNYIFLPAAGNREGQSPRWYAGSYGYYWSRTLTNGQLLRAHFLYLDGSKQDMSSSYRCDAFPVRPVRSTVRINLFKGKFSVSATKQVQFTKGNLYWDGSAFWFEENQTDYQTSWNASHVSHFYWTNLTDYQSGNASYMPYAQTYSYSSQSTTDTFWCGEENPLTVEGTSGLYALTSGEWNYLINSRTNASRLYKYGVTVTNNETSYTNCLIIAPDDFTGTLESSYTLEDVNNLGLVCLPAAGDRYGSSFYGGGSGGDYWSATPYEYNPSTSYYLFIYSDYVDPANRNSRSLGRSVRLVK